MPRCKTVPEYISATTLWDLIRPIANSVTADQAAECKLKFAISKGEGHATRWWYKTNEALAFFGGEAYICDNGWLRSRQVSSQ